MTAGTLVPPARSLSSEPTPAQEGLSRFSEAIDPRLMGPRLAAALAPALGTGTASCHVLDAKYQPGVGATVLYRSGDRLVRGDLVTSTEAAGTDSVPVVAPGVALSVFPADPDLPHLPLVTDPDHLGRALATALGRTPPAGSRQRSSCRSTLLRYRPGKRATVLVSYRAEPETFVAKAYHDPVKAAAVMAESDALRSVAERGGELRFAPTAAHLPELAVVVQHTVAGSALTAVLDTPHGPTRGADAALRRAGRALAELHEARPVSQRHRSVERELRRFTQRASRIRDVDPRNGDALLGLAERLAQTVAQLPAPEIGTVHGDCKPSQFLLGPRHVHLLDVDHLGVSDVAADVGTFVASLRQLGVRRGLSVGTRTMPSAYDELADAFLRGYLATRSRDQEVARITWQEAVALERKALRAFARAPRSPLVTALTTEAHRRLDVLGGSRSHG